MTDAPVDTTKYHQPAGCHWRGRPHKNPCVSRAREDGKALKVVRDVLRQVEEALDLLRHSYATGPYGPLERPRTAGRPALIDRSRELFDDPDLAIMCAVLDQVTDLLQPWMRDRNAKVERWVQPGPAEELLTALPDCYEAEVGDEQFMGQQAVLGQLRARLTSQYRSNQWMLRGLLDEIDRFMQEMVDEQRDAEGETP